jgi:ribonucleoside-diphosphate reductase beta chain
MQFYARFQDEVIAAPDAIAAHVDRARAQVSAAFRALFDGALVDFHERLVASPADTAAKLRFVTLYHLVLEGTLGLTSFKFTTDYLSGAGLLPGFVDGYGRIHHDETRHIGYGVWLLREAVRADPAAGDVIRDALRELLPHAAGALSGGDVDFAAIGVDADAVRTFALEGLTRRLDIIGVPLSTL